MYNNIWGKHKEKKIKKHMIFITKKEKWIPKKYILKNYMMDDLQTKIKKKQKVILPIGKDQ